MEQKTSAKDVLFRSLEKTAFYNAETTLFTDVYAFLCFCKEVSLLHFLDIEFNTEFSESEEWNLFFYWYFFAVLQTDIYSPCSVKAHNFPVR